MAALAAVLKGIARSAWRDLRSLGSIAGNNLLALIVLMMANEPPNRPSSATFFIWIIGFLFLFPLSADLLRQVPVERLHLWPLSTSQRLVLEWSTLVLNPIVLVALVFTAVTRQVIVGLALLVAGAAIEGVTSVATHLAKKAPHWNPTLLVPRFPGRLGGLLQNQLRQYLGALDVYFAAVLAVGGGIYCHLSPNADPAARTMIGLLVVLFLSTLAQCQFGFDSAAEQARYRLLPLSGLQLLLAKDLAWFALVVVLAWPFRVLPWIAASAVALAIGHDTAVRYPIAQRRWRFAQGRLAPTGFFQIIGLVSAGVAVEHFGPFLVLLFLAAWLVSLFFYARQWER